MNPEVREETKREVNVVEFVAVIKNYTADILYEEGDTLTVISNEIRKCTHCDGDVGCIYCQGTSREFPPYYFMQKDEKVNLDEMQHAQEVISVRAIRKQLDFLKFKYHPKDKKDKLKNALILARRQNPDRAMEFDKGKKGGNK